MITKEIENDIISSIKEAKDKKKAVIEMQEKHDMTVKDVIKICVGPGNMSRQNFNRYFGAEVAQANKEIRDESVAQSENAFINFKKLKDENRRLMNEVNEMCKKVNQLTKENEGLRVSLKQTSEQIPSSSEEYSELQNAVERIMNAAGVEEETLNKSVNKVIEILSGSETKLRNVSEVCEYYKKQINAPVTELINGKREKVNKENQIYKDFIVKILSI